MRYGEAHGKRPVGVAIPVIHRNDGRFTYTLGPPQGCQVCRTRSVSRARSTREGFCYSSLLQRITLAEHSCQWLSRFNELISDTSCFSARKQVVLIIQRSVSVETNRHLSNCSSVLHH